MTQFYFSFFCLGSGQTFIDDWYITCYNLIFTAFPLCISALSDSDIDLNDNKVTKKNLAILYKESRDTYKIFSFGRFVWTLFKGILYSLIIFIESNIRQILVIRGYFSNIWFLSLKSYMCVLSVVSSNLLINTNFIVIYLPLSIFISTFALFFCFLVLNHYGIIFEFNSKASIVSSLTSPILYLSIFLILCFSIVVDYSFKLFNIFFSNNLTFRILLKKSLKKAKKKKDSLAINNISSKSYSNCNKDNSKSNSNSNPNENKKHKVRSSFNNPGFANNKLIMKSPNFILNNINKNYSFKQNQNNYQVKSNAFILKFRGINKINYNEN